MKKLIILLGILSVFVAMSLMAMDVTLAWDKNLETDLAGYKLWQSPTQGGPYTLAATVGPTVQEYQIKNLAKQRWYFVATAYDTENLESAYSNEVNTDGKPGAPGGFHVKVTVEVTTP